MGETGYQYISMSPRLIIIVTTKTTNETQLAAKVSEIGSYQHLLNSRCDYYTHHLQNVSKQINS